MRKQNVISEPLAKYFWHFLKIATLIENDKLEEYEEMYA